MGVSIPGHEAPPAAERWAQLSQRVPDHPIATVRIEAPQLWTRSSVAPLNDQRTIDLELYPVGIPPTVDQVLCCTPHPDPNYGPGQLSHP